MRPYFEAKRDADDAVEASGLDWTIVRPGALTNEPGTGTVDLARVARPLRRGHRATTSRSCSTTACSADNTIRAQFELLAGPTPSRSPSKRYNPALARLP